MLINPVRRCLMTNNKMRQLTGVFLTLLLFGTSFAVPGIPPFGVYQGVEFSPVISVTESNEDRIVLQLSMENLPTEYTVNFNYVPPGLWGEMNRHDALLPRFTIFLALPATGNPTVHIDEWQTTDYSVLPITLGDNNPQPPLVTLQEVGILGSARVVPVTFHPITYVNGESTCDVVTEATVRIEIDDETGDNPVTNPRGAFSVPWKKVLQAVVTNWEDIPNIQFSTPSHILIIHPDEFDVELDDFVTWKEQRGIYVTRLSLSEIGPDPSNVQVRNAIIERVEDSVPEVDYVILVGDEWQMNVYITYTDDPPTRFSWYSLSGWYVNEGFFSAVFGDDVFPDVFLGRWVVDANYGVRRIATRSVSYEKNTFATDSLRFEIAAVAADNTELSQRETKEYVRSMLIRNGFETVHSLWGGESVGPELMIDWVDDGVAFVNYRGSGWSVGWAGIHFYTFNIDDLNNVHRLPIVTGIGCGVCNFYDSSSDCFGEEWMLAGTLQQPRGSVGFIGPGWNTHTVFNDCLDSMLYKSFLEYEVRNLSPALVAGKMMTWGTFGEFLDESAMEEVLSTMFRQYYTISDPSLQVFTDTPVRLQIQLPDTIAYGDYLLTVEIDNMNEVDADSIQMTVWEGPGDFHTAWSSSGGNTVSVPVSLETGQEVVVTLTGDNVLAWQKTVYVGSQSPASEHPDAAVPGTIELAQNYPNPFNPETVIEFTVPRTANVRLEIFNVLGQRVRLLTDSRYTAGRHSIIWNGTSDLGQESGSGIYLYRLSVGEEVVSKKMMLLR